MVGVVDRGFHLAGPQIVPGEFCFRRAVWTAAGNDAAVAAAVIKDGGNTDQTIETLQAARLKMFVAPLMFATLYAFWLQ